MYTVKDNELYAGRKKLGNSAAIFVDGRQDSVPYIKSHGWEEVHTAMLPEGDYVMVTPSGLTVGIEEKKSHDLGNSLRNRRLQRQLRKLEHAVDIPLLGLRFGTKEYYRPRATVDTFEPDWWQFNNLSMPIELLKWSLRGGIILLPPEPDRLMMVLWRARNILQKGRHLFSIVAGTDEKPTGTKFQRAVQRMVEGVGPKTAGKIDGHYKGSIRKLLFDNEEGWTKAGLNKGQRTALEEIVNEDECNSTG